MKKPPKFEDPFSEGRAAGARTYSNGITLGKPVVHASTRKTQAQQPAFHRFAMREGELGNSNPCKFCANPIQRLCLIPYAAHFLPSIHWTRRLSDGLKLLTFLHSIILATSSKGNLISN